MKIWELSTQDKVQITLKHYEEQYYKYFDSQFMGQPVSTWGEIEMMVYKGGGKYCDAPYFVSGKPIFSGKTVETLGDLIRDSAEILPLVHEPFAVYAINVLNVINCIDYSRAEPKKLSSGTLIGFNRFAFHEQLLTGKHIFKIPEMLSTKIFVSDQFKAKVEEHKLTGFAFYEVWNSVASEKQLAVEDWDPEADDYPLTFGEAIKIAELGERAVVSGRYKWQRNKEGILVLGERISDGSVVWMDPVHVPVPHLQMKWNTHPLSEF
ncbi:imm11 family protein [Paenibacillus sp. sptzw28]|uniref:imm11 family protein n=1 Tax=Paenibacillus sp. sptzw28 TaxID=715179 RepID=UPI0037C99A16